MTRNEVIRAVQPRPPASKVRGKDAKKRFSVRDGFHLKDRNDEKREEIDHAITAESTIVPTATNQVLGETRSDTTNGPKQIDGVHHRAACVDSDVAVIFEFLHRPAPLFAIGEPISDGRRDSLDRQEDTGPAQDPESMVALGSAHRQTEAAAILSRLGPSADWLVYRHRANATPRRKDEQLEQMITEVLDAKANQVLQPTVPKEMKRRCAHQRHQRRDRTLGVPIYLQGYSGGARFGLPRTPGSSNAERRPALTYAAGSFTTHRSRLREKAAVPIKTEKLLGRLDELRSFPAVVARVLQTEREKRQEFVDQHGEDLVRKNKRLHTLVPPLQRPVHTPVFPSVVEHRQQQAFRRKQRVDESQEVTLKSVVNRWQNRRLEIQQQERHHYAQSQWLLITLLGQATARWMKQFRECRAQREMIFRLAMVKKIQRSWKQRQYLRQNARAALSMPPDSPLRTQFFRMPAVLKAVRAVQVGMRRSLARKRVRDNTRAAEIIVTSWLEFQDVKFRRLILRFRKRVRDFQTMWRTWRSITDARIKLLLLVWAKVEKKHKRRGGLATSVEVDPTQSDATSPLGHHPPVAAAEIIHRHLRNGGMVLTAVSALAARQSDGKISPRHSPSKRITHEFELRRTAEEDLQLAMRDFFYTNNRSPASKAVASPSHHASKSHAPHQRSPRSIAVKNSTVSTLQPWRPSQHQQAEKIPLSLKVSLLRNLLSQKRKQFQATKERMRAEWKENRQQLRRTDFRYDVLEELAAFQRFEAELAVFLVLRSISEHEIMELIQQAHQSLRVPTNPRSSVASSVALGSEPSFSPSPPTLGRPLTPTAPSTSSNSKSRHEGPRRSTLLTIRTCPSTERE